MANKKNGGARYISNVVGDVGVADVVAVYADAVMAVASFIAILYTPAGSFDWIWYQGEGFWSIFKPLQCEI